MQYLDIEPTRGKYYISEGFIMGDNDKQSAHNIGAHKMILAEFDSEDEAKKQLKTFVGVVSPFVWKW